MNQSFYQFAEPYYLLLLVILPFVFWFLTKKKSFVAIQYSSIELFEGIPKTLKERLVFIPYLLRTIALGFIIIALARPIHGNSSSEIISESVDILLTIDTSGSMKALDFKLNNERVNRLEVVKSVVRDFVSKRPSDRIGMVIFGEEAYTQCPLTFDKSTILQFLDWIEIGLAGDGTSIGTALATSVKRLKDQKTKSKIIILLTDGRNHGLEITPEMAAKAAKDYGIKIYTIGVGSRGLVPFPEETPFGTRIIEAKLELDEETLKEIADITGGLYFRATETDELEKIYETIDELEKTEVKIKEYHNYNDLFYYFVYWGLIFLLIELILNHTIFLKIP